MTHWLHVVYSIPYFLGAGTVFALIHLYWWQRCRYLDRHHPKSDGRPHTVPHLPLTWITGLMGVFTLGYILLAATDAQEQSVTLSKSVARCWQEAYASTKAQIDLNAQNDAISRQQQNLQREFDRDTVDWISKLLDPPGLADRPPNDPERQQFGLRISQEYFGQIDTLGKQFDDLVTKRKQLDDQRNQHPLPEQTCGK